MPMSRLDPRAVVFLADRHQHVIGFHKVGLAGRHGLLTTDSSVIASRAGTARLQLAVLVDELSGGRLLTIGMPDIVSSFPPLRRLHHSKPIERRR
jgi:hypothetical protein